MVNDVFSSGTLESEFKEVHSNMDAAYAYQGHLFLIKVHSSRTASH